jgi:hypothetical protein
MSGLKPEPEALSAPITWQDLSEGASLILGDLEQIATKYDQLNVARLVQVVKIMASNPAVAQLVATGINLLRQHWPWAKS